MLNYARNNRWNGIFTAIMLVAMVLFVVPATYADSGHIGSKRPCELFQWLG